MFGYWISGDGGELLPRSSWTRNMSELGGNNAPPPRTKRNGARTFKNPPQPHMCIQDKIIGSDIPCYINVLSWEKVDMPASPSQPVPLYGGMQLTPPRTEDKKTSVFAVIAHPEILKQRGKSSKDQEDQANFIEVLLDFVESMNKGILFDRSYSILKDRDITGELKEVWLAVQTQKETNVSPVVVINQQQPQQPQPQQQQETWIDAQPEQQHQHHQMMVPQLPPQNQRIPQQQQQVFDYVPQPPQYGQQQPEYVYPPSEPYLRQPQYGGADSVYNYRSGPGVRSLPQQPPPTPHFPQMPPPRQHMQMPPPPQYMQAPGYTPVPPQQQMNPNVMQPNVNHYPDYMMIQHQVHADQMHHHMMQQQQQQQQQQQEAQYNTNPSGGVNGAMMPNACMQNAQHHQKRNYYNKPVQHQQQQQQQQMKNNPTNKRQHQNNSNTSDGTCKSPVKVLQRDASLQNNKPNPPISHDKAIIKIMEKNSAVESGVCSVQVTDLDEDDAKTVTTATTPAKYAAVSETTTTEETTLTYAAALKEFKDTPDYGTKVVVDETKDRQVNVQDEASKETTPTNHSFQSSNQKQQRSIKTVLKRNKSCANDVKTWAKDAKGGGLKNGMRQNPSEPLRNQDNKDLHHSKTSQSSGGEVVVSSSNSSVSWKQQKSSTDSPKRAQSTVNSIIKSVFKINNQGAGDDGAGTVKKLRTMNANSNQARNHPKSAPSPSTFNKRTATEHEENNQGFTILKKSSEVSMSSASEELVANDIAQLSIQESSSSTSTEVSDFSYS